MPLSFNEEYFSTDSKGYLNYQDYPHFLQRAQWLYNYYTANNLTGTVYILGVGFGYIIKHLKSLVPNQYWNRFQGVEFSAYAYSKCEELGVADQVTFIDIANFDWSSVPTLDIVVSWNMLDCLPNETKAQQITTLLNNKANRQLHVICITEDDLNADSYIAEGYFIKNRSYWAKLFTNTGTVLVEFATGKVWVHRITGWQQEIDWYIPLIKGRVSQ